MTAPAAEHYVLRDRRWVRVRIPEFVFREKFTSWPNGYKFDADHAQQTITDRVGGLYTNKHYRWEVPGPYPLVGIGWAWDAAGNVYLERPGGELPVALVRLRRA